MTQATIGGLTVRLAGGTDGNGGGQGPAVILLHGFGAPADDLVALWPYLEAPRGTRFLFPAAPLTLPMGGDGRAWWMLDLDRMQRDRESGRPRDLSQELPKGLPEARAKVLRMLGELEKQQGLDLRRTVLGGFSQGAMLACDVTLRLDRAPAGLVLLSGTLVAQQEWTPLMHRRKGLKVLQSHGNQDPLLPFAQAEKLRDLLSKAGLIVEWVGFRGGHEIPEAVLARMNAWLRGALPA